jgi:hypothetical protein
VKQEAAVSAVTACLVSLACLFAFQAAQDSAAIPGRDGADHMGGCEIDARTESLVELRVQLAEIRREIALNAGIGGDTAPEDRQLSGRSMLTRIEGLEDAVAELTTTRGIEGRASVEDFVPAPIVNVSPGDTELSYARLYATAESSFEADQGIPLGDYEDAIGDALHRAGAIEVHSTDCRTTICKVTYSKTEGPEPPDWPGGEQELVDTLARDAQGQDVEIRYASDPSGNDVMYIQLR